MALQDQKITSSDLANKGVVGLPDTPNLSTLVMQQKFDEIATAVIVPKFNALIDYLIESLAPIVSDNPQDGEVLIYFADSSQYKNGVYRTTLSALKDVNVGGVQNKMFLCYDADRNLWYPEASSGVMETISACKDVSIVNPQTGDIFKFDGTAWANVPDERGLLIVFNIDSEDGATITALTPSGDTVTATSLGGGQYVIKSDEYGEWHLTGLKNSETVTATVNVDTAKIYDVTMNFFAATITVTYPADATVTCSKDSEEYTATGSPYTFTVHESGDWVIEGTRSGITETQTVTITTNGQSESVTLTILPDGSTITPTDSIPTLLHCADIWDKSYTSIGEVLDDSTSLFKVLTTDNSIDYLVRSTTYASSVTADEDAMAMIGSYDYASDTLIADATWGVAIYNSTYKDIVLNGKVPQMTSNTTPKGVASASSTYTGYDAYKAFDGNKVAPNLWASNNSVSTGNTSPEEYIAYQFTSALKCCLAIYSATTPIQSWTVKGSNNGSDWEILGSGGVQTSVDDVLLFFNTKVDSYKYYRLYVTQKNTGQSTAYLPNALEVQFLGRENGGVQSWLKAGGIDKSYTTLAEVLADTTTLSALISNHDAVDYLVTAKGLIDGIVADSNAMSYIGLNNYCANTLLADAEWCTAIANSTYKESVLNVKVPTMTSNTTPSGEVSASGVISDTYQPYLAFDGTNSSAGDCWHSSATAPHWIKYHFPSSVKIVRADIMTRNGSATGATISAIIQGSNDDSVWEDLKTITYLDNANTSYSFNFPNDDSYEYYRIYSSTAQYLILGIVQFYGREDV